MTATDSTIQRLISGKPNEDSLAQLVREILALKDKLNHPESQSVYFRAGLEANRKKLIKLVEEYNSIRELVNENTADYYRLQIKYSQKEIDELEKKKFITMFNGGLKLAGHKNNIKRLGNLMLIKERYPNLKQITDYTNEELAMFFE